jgi:hypothetical protein
MNNLLLKTAALMLGLTLTSTVSALSQRADNFVLLDHRGQAQELYYQSDASAIVIIAQSNGCELSRSAIPDYQAFRDDYAARGVQVFMINSNPNDDRADIIGEAEEWNIDIPILDDSAQIVGQSLGLTHSAEVLVIDPRGWNIVYRGPLKTTDQNAVRDKVDALIAGQTVPYQQLASTGCLIDFPAANAGESISYSKTIAPILQENCVHCHSEGGIAPWAMSDYRMVQGFAPMMREVIRTKRMPPWHADPALGKWNHDAGISDAETQTLVSWIEAGAPRGEGEDPLAMEKVKAPEWPLGEPDLIVEIPAYDVPATGIVDYQFPMVANTLGYDAWVVAATVIPGDTQAVHHVLMGSVNVAPKSDDPKEGVFENYIMGYAPGNESAHMPEGTGVFVPAGATYLFQLHYTPYGKATTDVTRVGLYFADSDKPPVNFLRQQVVLNPKLSIPPNAPAHEEAAYFEFYHEAIIFSLVPHSHYRGRASSFELVYPDGETEVILSVPNYDFNWQRTYSLAEPKRVPEGTRIVHRTIYDNSAKNPGNPDPERTVPWGLQSHDEMLYGSVSYSWTEETSAAPIHDNQRADTAQWMGFMDKDMNGKVARSELPERLREGLGWRWYLLDRNFDGGLNLDEMERLVDGLNKDES